MQWLSDFLYQIVTVFLFTIAMAFTFYFLSEKDQTKMLWCAFFAWVFAGLAIVVFLQNKVLIEPEFSGVLRPSDEPLPTIGVSIPSGALLLNLGSNFAYSTKPSFVVLQVTDTDVISIDRIKNGISVNASVYSPDGRIVAEIKNNEFSINPNNYFRIKRTNKSTLVIYNQGGEEAMERRAALLRDS